MIPLLEPSLQLGSNNRKRTVNRLNQDNQQDSRLEQQVKSGLFALGSKARE